MLWFDEHWYHLQFKQVVNPSPSWICPWHDIFAKSMLFVHTAIVWTCSDLRCRSSPNTFAQFKPNWTSTSIDLCPRAQTHINLHVFNVCLITLYISCGLMPLPTCVDKQKMAIKHFFRFVDLLPMAPHRQEVTWTGTFLPNLNLIGLQV